MTIMDFHSAMAVIDAFFVTRERSCISEQTLKQLCDVLMKVWKHVVL